jgi:hypothetical protein
VLGGAAFVTGANIAINGGQHIIAGTQGVNM